MKFAILFAACVVACSARSLEKRASGQSPKVFSALDVLRGGANKALGVDQIQELWLNVKAGQDFPLIATIPKANVDCSAVKPGFYANDGEGKCQAFDRCDINGNLTSYLCPNMTLFNQITLVCDWWFNIDCAQARAFYDYTNSRLYAEGAVLLDDEPDYVMTITGAVAANGGKGSGEATLKVKVKKPKAKKPAAE